MGEKTHESKEAESFVKDVINSNAYEVIKTKYGDYLAEKTEEKGGEGNER